MAHALALTLALLVPAPAPTIVRPSDVAARPYDLLAHIDHYPEAAALAAGRRYDDAIRLLRAIPDDQDLAAFYHHRVKHPIRSSHRRLLIAGCLLAAGKKDEARAELRGLYEANLTPGYRIPEEAAWLLFAWECEAGHEQFRRWLDRVLPVQAETYKGSFQELLDMKIAFAAGRFDSAAETLRGLGCYSGYSGLRRTTDRIVAVERLLRLEPKSADFFQKRLADAYPDDDHRIRDCSHLGWIHALGETGNDKHIPFLRELFGRAQNYYANLEVILALGKLGDKESAPALFQMRHGDLEHQKYINRLLRWAAKTDQGDIETQEDAVKVFIRWEEWLKKR
jgi:hypothetical protein